MQNGDTLHVQGNAVSSYVDLILTKRLEIYGPGYFLNEIPNTQADKNSARTGGMTFNPGSEGSVIVGLEIQGRVQVNANNITIRRNVIKFNTDPQLSSGTGVSDLVITQNYLEKGYALCCLTAVSIG